MKYSGMTVNERLYVSGLFDDFYKAVEEKNVENARILLREVELDEESINSILEQLKL